MINLYKTKRIFKKKFQPISALENNRTETFTDKDKAEMITIQYEKMHRILRCASKIYFPNIFTRFAYVTTIFFIFAKRT